MNANAPDPHVCKWITVEECPSEARAARSAALAVARALELPLADATALLAHRGRLPRAFDPPAAEALAGQLTGAGARLAVEERPGAGAHCPSHPRLHADAACARCGAVICSLCEARAAAASCARCARKRERSRGFYRARVAVLLVVLAGVLLYAWRDVSRRRARVAWGRPLEVGLVLVRLGNVDTRKFDRLRERVPALEARLAQERARHTGDSMRPFVFHVQGPVDAPEPPPTLRPGFAALVEHTYDRWRWVSRVDERAGVDAGRLDMRVYVVARPVRGQRATIEGGSEQGGHVGVVEVELGDQMIDFSLFVAAHELLHLLAATDKYDDAGHPVVPEGLAEPDLQPLYPQRFAEIMARHRALGPGVDVPPETLRELCVGDATAREIGWLR